MYDGCRTWRRLLTRQAEGVISPSERALLDNHLAECGACREARTADVALQSILFSRESRMIPGVARTFDDTVVRTLRAPIHAAIPLVLWQKLQTFWSDLSLEFCGQLAGGALVAASVTGFFVVSALHPVNGRPAADATSIATRERNEPPVPLESLFQSASPRAAMLWATPVRAPGRLPGIRQYDPLASPNRESRKPKTAGPRRHGSLMSNVTLS